MRLPFLFRSFNSKDNTCVSFNKDIFNYYNRKSDSIWVQIESLLAEKAGDSPVRGNVARRQKGCRPRRGIEPLGENHAFEYKKASR